MATFNEIHVRAKVTVGGTTVFTPYVISFNVKKARSSRVSTCAVALKVSTSTSFELGGIITISAGVGTVNKIFTGYVHQISVSPIWEDSSFMAVQITGRDELFKLDGQHFTRRIESSKLARYGAITAVTEENEKHKERFPAKIYDNTERLMSHQILNAEGQVTAAPSPSFGQIDPSGTFGPIRFAVQDLGKKE